MSHAPAQLALIAPEVDLLDLVQRQHDMLLRMSTKAGHLAQRVTHEPLGYCSHNRESERCISYREVMTDAVTYLETVQAPEAAPSAAGRAS